jgi:radical SAM superfamily enzyme YgiQ (UPF0313 family)
VLVKVDLYHLHRGLNFASVVYPIVIDVLKLWSESKGWEARGSICKASKVDLETNAEVVGISVYTQTAPAAYRVSAELRRRGKIVILGGPHFRGPSTLEEAAPYCDVIVSSTCEEQWRALLDAVTIETLLPNRDKPLYVVDDENRFRYPNNFHQSLRNRRWYQISSIPTSIGCPYDCSFCAAYMQGKYITRQIETIRSEVSHTPDRILFFCDASFGLHKKFAIELMHALAPLNKKIAVETTLARLADQQFLEALAVGGVKWIMVGIETLGLRLRKHGSADLQDSLSEVVARAHDLGMLIQGMFICGMDEDDLDSFDRIYQCCDRSRLDAAVVGILTPYPDTPLYRQLQAERRIIDRDWKHYDAHHVVYRPRRMTVDQLIEGYLGLHRALDGRRSLLREAIENLETHGIGAESMVMIGHGLYRRFDSIKKTRLLRENQRQLARLAAGGAVSTPARAPGGLRES